MTDVLRYTAFTTDPTGGNPAGVVLDATGLDEPAMQRIAAEVGYSETAFAVPLGERRHRVRYFSPLAEVAFCGHATIATAVALAGRDGTGDLTFEIPAGTIDVRTGKDDTVFASLTSIPARSRPATPDELTPLLAALHWSADDLDPAWPAHIAFAGNDHPILITRTRARLADLHYDFEALKSLMTTRAWTTIQLIHPAPDAFHARNPFPVGGVVEDPATGAAAAAFGAYLRATGRVPEPRRIRILQGEDMGRPSELFVDVTPDNPRITVTGSAVPLGG